MNDERTTEFVLARFFFPSLDTQRRGRSRSCIIRPRRVLLNSIWRRGSCILVLDGISAVHDWRLLDKWIAKRRHSDTIEMKTAGAKQDFLRCSDKDLMTMAAISVRMSY